MWDFYNNLQDSKLIKSSKQIHLISQTKVTSVTIQLQLHISDLRQAGVWINDAVAAGWNLPSSLYKWWLPSSTVLKLLLLRQLISSKREKHSGFLLFGVILKLTSNVDQAQTGENWQHGVYLVCLCILCPQQYKNTFWVRVEQYFQWLLVARIRKYVIFVTIPAQNKVYLSVKRQRFPGILMIN